VSELQLTVHSAGSPKTHADLSPGDVDRCYQEFRSSAVAAKLKELLEGL
jgi:hypothetical protein